jgi:anaerobic ribonucleoside-triphosphate reductase
MDNQNDIIDVSTEISLDDSERQRCEVWTRVMGYHRPVSSFNRGKKSEHYERRHFREDCVSIG